MYPDFVHGYVLFASLLVLRFFPTGVASLSIPFVIFGDLLAWSIGTIIAGPGFPGKTWSGSTACLITCLIIAALYQSLQLVSLPVGVLGAVTATALEVALVRDDIFIKPIAGAVVMKHGMCHPLDKLSPTIRQQTEVLLNRGRLSGIWPLPIKSQVFDWLAVAGGFRCSRSRPYMTRYCTGQV